MFDILDVASHTFGNSTSLSCEEVLYRLSISYKVTKEKLPSYEKLVTFLGYIEDQDDGIITFTGETEQTLYVGRAVFEDSYITYLDKLVDDEEVDVSIRITKKIFNGTLSVYRLDLFIAFLKELSVTDHFTNFTELFKIAGEHLRFRVIDRSCLLSTSTIAFSDDDISWIEDKSRHEMLEDCSDASIFLQKTEYAVVPQDFSVKQSTVECKEISKLFDRLCSILSFIYLANTANIMGDCAVLQFDPKHPGEAYNLDELGNNQSVRRVYEWVYKDSNCVDKAGIARGIINLYCKAKEDILNIDEQVLNSIKSDYVIYQKNHAETYIEMKNKISDFILDTGEQIQELAGNLTDGLKNNFLAIIGFALTVILSDSIDVKVWAEAEVSPRVIGICTLFIIASICYLVVTIFSNNSKWSWMEKSYGDLKNNYKGTLDDADIQEAFGNDKVKEDAHNQYKKIRCVVVVVWTVIILAMGSFTFLMSRPLLQNTKQINTVEKAALENIDEVIESSESDTTEDIEQPTTEAHNDPDD
ncbi:MAG: hypothetical protein J6N70_03405 [Oribacterium sp.]|nr:hypothetical protein [Oribacterium sp.]MBQ5330771.1 hypothetical protein [Oscillospiraceae bacterium]